MDFCTRAVKLSCYSGFFGNLLVSVVKTQSLGGEKQGGTVSCEVQCSLYCHLSGTVFVTILLALVHMSSVLRSLRCENPMESSHQAVSSVLSFLAFDGSSDCPFLSYKT